MEFTPEDRSLSSGDSNNRTYIGDVDNYRNVNRYLKYETYYFLEQFDVLQDELYPQGICLTEEYLFVSSYSGEFGQTGKILIYDKNSGECLLTLEVDENSHLGGITFDGKYIWICNSSKMALERLDYSMIKQMIVINRNETIDVRKLVEWFRVENVPSSVTYYRGVLWVVTHSVQSNSVMCGYMFNEKTKIFQFWESISLPPKVQGVAFSDVGDVFLSISYGRKNTSYIKKYTSINSIKNNLDEFIECIELPPCSEGIACEDNKIYVLFESAATKYLNGTDGKGRSRDPLDKILVIQYK